MSKDKNPLRAYSTYVAQRIRKKWSSKPGMKGVHVEFQIARDGSVGGVRLRDSSGDPAYDQAALDALASVTFKPLPDDLPLDHVPIAYLF